VPAFPQHHQSGDAGIDILEAYVVDLSRFFVAEALKSCKECVRKTLGFDAPG
jgi:hypothetical protein